MSLEKEMVQWDAATADDGPVRVTGPSSTSSETPNAGETSTHEELPDLPDTPEETCTKVQTLPNTSFSPLNSSN